MKHPIEVKILMDKPTNCGECPFYGPPHLEFGGSDPAYCKLLSGDHNIWECIVSEKGIHDRCPLPTEGKITAAYTKSSYQHEYHLPQPKENDE